MQILGQQRYEGQQRGNSEVKYNVLRSRFPGKSFKFRGLAFGARLTVLKERHGFPGSPDSRRQSRMSELIREDCPLGM